MSSLQIKEPPHLWARKKMEQGQSSGLKSVEDSCGKSCFDIGCDRNEKLVDGGIDHLMILAQSAELVEAQHHFCSLHKNNQSCEDEFHYGQQQTTRPLEDVTIFGKGTARQQGRIRLTQLRHYARSKHTHTADGLPMTSSADRLDFPKVEQIHGHEVERDLEHQDHEDRLYNCNTGVEAEANVNQASVNDQFVQVPRPSRYGMVNDKQVHSPNIGVYDSFDTGQRQNGRLLPIDEQQLHKRKHLHDTASQTQQEVTGEGRKEPPLVYPSFFKCYVSDRAQVLKEKQRIARQVRIQRRQRGNKQECVPTEKAISPTQTEKKRFRPIAPRLFWSNDHFIAHPREQQRAFEPSKRFQGEHMVTNGQVKHVGAEPQSCDTEEQQIRATEHGEQFVNKQRVSKNSHKCLNSSQEIGLSNLQPNEIFSEVQSNSHQASYMKKYLAETHVEKEHNPLRVKGGVRLTHLRCQARVKYVVEKGKGLLQSNGGTKMVLVD
ncbi:uncharacterized protein [Aristolochia californica]|uniref:uncharacterized protein n=1 Tax=Aristolochia californica TaxID=171875 RepID=UPI0035DBBA0B